MNAEGNAQREGIGIAKLLRCLFRSPKARGLLLVVLVLVAYLPALRAGFVWDDDKALTQNALLRSPEGLWKIWTRPSLIPQGHYWPLTYTTFWVEYQLWGDAPFGYHLNNVLLHAANVALIWVLLGRLAVPGAWWAAALFALHPVHVESVAWVIERKDVLSIFFYLTAFLAYLRYAREGSRRWYGLALALFVGAMLSKLMAVSFPVALLLALWWKRGAMGKREMLSVLPFFAVGAAIALADVALVQHRFGYDYGLSLAERLLIAGRAVWFYVAKLVWPVDLIAVYPRWEVDPAALWQWIFSGGVVLVVFALWGLRRRWGRGPVAAVAFFIITLVPVLGFIDFGFMAYSFVADRFQYLASLGLIALFCGAVARAATRVGSARRAILASGMGLLAAGMLILTWRQAALYRNMETLFRHTLASNPLSWTAYNNLGAALAERGDMEGAIPYYRRCLEIRPTDAEAHNNLANALAAQGKLQEAVEHYRTALRIHPANPEAHNNLANALIAQGTVEAALQHYAEALRLRPGDPAVHFNLGVALARSGRNNEAIRHYWEAIRLRPGDADFHYHLGNSLAQRGRFEEAAQRYAEALRLRPEFAEAHYHLGRVCARIGRVEEARLHFGETLRIQPDHLEAKKQLVKLTQP